MATIHATDAPKPGLLTIPGELRNSIYRMLLTNQYVDQSKPFIRAPLHPAILRTNRQIYREAASIFQEENSWIIAEVPASLFPVMLKSIPGVFGTDSDSIKYPVMRINLALPYPTRAVTFIIGDWAIETFIEVLWEVCENCTTLQEFRIFSLSLTVCETPFHRTSAVESKCVKPFAHVHSLRDLTIRGRVSPALVEDVVNRASSQFKDVAHTQSVSQAYADRIEEASLAGESSRALELISRATKYLCHVSWTNTFEALNADAHEAASSLTALAGFFSAAANEQAAALLEQREAVLLEQQAKPQSGGGLDMDAIGAFWEVVGSEKGDTGYSI